MKSLIKKIKFKNLNQELFYKALRIRMIEEKIVELYPFDKIQSPVHLSIGQEAIAVGLSQNLCDSDVIFINYRGHSFYLAKGGPLNLFFAELYGKKNGFSKGKAGSMHLAFPKKGIMGASAVVASTISHAVGFALANKIKSLPNLTISIFGDGATEQGVIHESLNFASLKKIPIIFLCENNNLAVHASLNERQSFKISDLPNVYGIDSFIIKKGYDLMHVYDEFNKIICDFKSNPRPIFIEANTFRYKEHVGPNDDFSAGYRSIKEYNSWLKLDELRSNNKLINEFSPYIRQEIDLAIDFAENSDTPSEEDLFSDVL